MPYLGSDRQLPAPFVPGYVQSVDGIKNTTISNISGNVAEGNLITTPADLAKFLRESVLGRGVISSVVMNQVMSEYDSDGGMPPRTVTDVVCNMYPTSDMDIQGAHEGYLSEMIYDPGHGHHDGYLLKCLGFEGWDISSISKVMNTMQEALYKTKGIVLGR
jgi:D-alanyl-D-alanine carboxypeptidase